MKEKIGRRFLGELFPPKEKRNFEKAHLKAYLKGHEYFRFGFKTLESGHRVPAWHEVKQEYFII